MTELEEKFYKTFGIEQKEYKGCNYAGLSCPYHSQECDTDCAYWEIYKTDYPPITDHILLELVCILATQEYRMWNISYFIGANLSKNDLKTKILTDIMSYSGKCKDDVRKLFED